MRRLSTIDFLVLTSLDHLLSKLQPLFTFSTKQATSIRRSTVLSLPLRSVFPGTPLIKTTFDRMTLIWTLNKPWHSNLNVFIINAAVDQNLWLCDLFPRCKLPLLLPPFIMAATASRSMPGREVPAEDLLWGWPSPGLTVRPKIKTKQYL